MLDDSRQRNGLSYQARKSAQMKISGRESSTTIGTAPFIRYFGTFYMLEQVAANAGTGCGWHLTLEPLKRHRPKSKPALGSETAGPRTGGDRQVNPGGKQAPSPPKSG